MNQHLKDELEMKKGREKSISCWGGNLHEDKEVRKKYSPGLPSDAIITLSKTTVKKEKVYLAYSCIPLLRKDKLETQGRNLEAGTEVETIGEPLLPGWLPMTCSHAMLSLLSSTTREHLPRGDTAYSELGPSARIINKDNTLCRHAHRPQNEQLY